MKGDTQMTGSQMFILVFILGGAFGMGFFLMELGVYYWGRNSGKKT